MTYLNFLPLTIENLMKHFALPYKQAQRILRLPQDDAEEFLEQVSEEIGGFGVESIDVEGRYLLYVNKGDTYDTTIMYDEDAMEFFIGTWGDWLEFVETESALQEEEE